MFRLTEYRKEPRRLADLLLWAGLIAPGVILNKDGAFQQTLAYRGPDLDSSTHGELIANATHLNNLLKRLGSGWGVFIEAQRRHAVHYPSAHWPNPVSALIDAERRVYFEDLAAHYETHYYLTLSWMPPSEQTRRLERLLYEQVPGQEQVNYREQLAYFQEEVERVRGMLADIMPYVEALSDADTLTYLHSTVSLKVHPVAVPEVPMYLDVLLTDMPLTAGIRPMLGHYYLRTVTLRAFPSSSYPGVLAGLNHLDFPLRYLLRYLAMDKVDATRVLTSYQRKWMAKRKSLLSTLWEAITHQESEMLNVDAVEKASDAGAAVEAVSDDRVSYGYVTATVTVWDEDPKIADEKLHAVERVINGRGFTCHAEDLNAVEAWLGSHPGNTYANVRRPLLSSLNLSHVMPASAVWAGPDRDDHLNAPALLQAETTGHTPFRLVLHQGDVGHTLIIGPTGSGKTTLLGFMAMQFLRYPGAQVYLFDKRQGLRTATAAVGGQWYDVGGDQARLAFQPLGAIDCAPELAWASAWVGELMAQQNVELSPEQRSEIWRSLNGLAATPVGQRTLTGLKNMVQDATLRAALEPSTLLGPHGQLLDAAEDHLQVGDWQCFEMEALFANMPRAVPPVLTYLFHRLEQRFTGAPTLLVLDEAWVYLDHPIFLDKIRDWLKTLRKANVSVIFTSQSLVDVSESPIAAVINESCLSRIFLPNARAMEAQSAPHYRALGLNERQLELLALATPKRDYYYMSPQGNRLFTLELGQIARAILTSSSKADLALVEQLSHAPTAESFAAAFLRAKGLAWAADLLRDTHPNTDLVSRFPEGMEVDHDAMAVVH
jgi:type IV secretion system protein VirB4